MRIGACGVCWTDLKKIDYGTVPAPRIFEIAWEAPLNTFDRPVLEFLMAGTSISRQAWWSPYTMIDLDLASSPFSAGAPEGGASG